MKSITKLLYLAIFSICIISCKKQNKQVTQTAEKPTNTAIIPVPKLEDDSYDWLVRHNDILEVKDSLDPEIVLMQIMPREEMPDNPRRILINETNQLLKQYAAENKIILLDLASKMLTSDGILTKTITLDFYHPNDTGYQIWGEALRPYIDSIED